MKILHVLPTLGVGGAERFLARLAPKLSERYGVEQRVVSLGNSGPIAQTMLANNIAVDCLSAKPYNLPTMVLGTREIVKNFRPDIIQTWLYRSDLVGAYAHGANDAKLVWNIRCSDMALPMHNRLERGWCSAISGSAPNSIIACGKRAQEYHTGLGYDRAKMRVIGNGYDFDALPSLAQIASDRRTRLAGRLRIGAAARYDKVKGYDILLAAAQRLKEDGLDVELAFAGRGCDANNRELAHLISSAGLDANVTLLGELEDMEPFYTGLDIFCLSSLSEGFPNVLCEAMAHGVPVVSTDAGDAAEILSGISDVVPPGDVGALYTALKAMVIRPADGRVELGLRGAAHVRSTYSIDVVTVQYYALYQSLMHASA